MLTFSSESDPPTGGGGACAGSPIGAPVFDQLAISLISTSVRLISSRQVLHSPLESTPHGGMRRLPVAAAIKGALSLACSYVSSGNGAMLPSLWHVTQRF